MKETHWKTKDWCCWRRFFKTFIGMFWNCWVVGKV